MVGRRLRLGTHSVRVEVEDGEVTLTGRLEDGADAASHEALAGEVPGVVGVHSKLAWTDEDSEC